jgi:iron complex outermembrane receptor protein
MKRKIFIAALIASCTTYAENMSNENNGIELAKTVVSTTGFGEKIQNQVNTVTVITGEEISEKNYKNISEVLEKIPGISIEKNVFGNRVDLRGQGLTRSIANVQILVDGVNLNPMVTSHAAMPLDSVEIDSIERIEIIPSGGSILYGGGTTGGVINIITKNKYEGKTESTIGAQVGSYGSTMYKGAFGYNITEKLMFRASYNKTDSDTYRKHAELDNEYYDFMLKYKINPKQDISFKYSNSVSDNLIPPALSASEVETDRSGNNIDLNDVYDLKRSREEYAVNYNYDISQKMKFNLNMSMSEFDLETTTPSGDDKVSLKPKFNYNYGKGSFVFGYDYLDNDYDRVTATNTLESNKLSQSFFIQNRHELGKAELTAGYRYEKADFNLQRFENNNKIYDYDRATDDSAYMIGLNYLYSESGKVYARVEKGFVIPGSNQLIDKDNSASSGYVVNNLQNENFTTVEAGFEDFIGNTSIKGAVFYTNTDEEIAVEHSGRMGTATHEWTYYNIDETVRKGIELSATHLIGNFRVSESIAMIDARIAKGDNKDNYVPGVSPMSVNLDFVYQFDKGIDLGLNINYKDKYYMNEDNSGGMVNSKTVTNLIASYHFDNGLKLYGGINNLMNEKYYEEVTYSSRSGYSYDPASERNYYVGFNYKF